MIDILTDGFGGPGYQLGIMFYGCADLYLVFCGYQLLRAIANDMA